MTEHLTRQQGQKLVAELTAKPKKSKYGNTKVVVDGERFDSKREAARWQFLRGRQQRGEIAHLERQPVFKLAIGDRPVLIRSKGYPNGRQAKYIADFAYFDGEHRIIEDAKGHRTRDFILKKAVVEAMFPAVKVVEV